LSIEAPHLQKNPPIETEKFAKIICDGDGGRRGGGGDLVFISVVVFLWLAGKDINLSVLRSKKLAGYSRNYY
jgi:hypothetical protein